MGLCYSVGDHLFADVCDVNSSFAKGKLTIMYTGKNQNKSDISREAVEAALPSLYNVPIVCHYEIKDNMIGGHDVDVVKNSEGDIVMRTLTTPCGVVPESASFSFQTMEDENGVEHEYLVADNVLLWKRQDVYRHIANDLGGEVDHSMEIEVKELGGHMGDDGYYCVDNFQFVALCLLESVDPCFGGSRLELYAAQKFKSQMEEMMNDLRETFDVLPMSLENINEKDEEGGNEVLANENEVVLNDEVIENTETTFAQNEDVKEDDVVEDHEEYSENSDQVGEHQDVVNEPENFALEGDRQYALHEAVRNLGVTQKEWGVEPLYWLIDYDVEISEVYVCSNEDFEMYGFTFRMDGDVAVIDAESKKRKKYAIVDFEEGEAQTNAFSTNIVELFGKCQSASEQKFSEMEKELNELRAFKEQKESDELEAKRFEVLEKFSDMAGNEMYDALVNDHTAYSAEELEEKCYAIRGRLSAVQSANFSLNQQKGMRLVIDDNDGASDEDEPYGGLFVKYHVGQ